MEIILNDVLRGDNIEKYYIVYEYPQKIFEKLKREKGADKVQLIQGPFKMEMLDTLNLNKRNEDSAHAVMLLDDGNHQSNLHFQKIQILHFQVT